MIQSPLDPQDLSDLDSDPSNVGSSQLVLQPQDEEEPSNSVNGEPILNPLRTDSIDARRDALRQRQQRHQAWSVLTKSMLGAVVVSTVPLIILGSILYLRPSKDPTALIPAEEVQQTERRFGLGAGVMAISAGLVAALLARRTLRPVVKASSVSSHLVNRLRGANRQPDSQNGGQNELNALEFNLQTLGRQLPSLISKQETRDEWQNIFMDVSQRLRDSRSQEDILRTAAVEVRQRFRTERVAVLQFQENGEGCFVEESLVQGWPKLLRSTVPEGSFVDGYLDQYHQGCTRVVENIYTANLEDGYIALLESFKVKANLIAPILTNGKLFGLLIADQCSGPRFWQKAEIDLLAQVAAQVSFALEYVRLLDEIDQRANRSQLFINLSRQICTSLNTEDVLQTTVTEVRKAINADRVIVYSFDEQWYGTVVAEAVLPGYPKALWAEIHDPCFSEGYVDKYQAGRVQATVNVQDAGLTPCHLKQLEPYSVRANLVAPILKDGRLFGLLIAHQCSGPRQWQPSEIDWFAQISTQVGFAIDQAKLLEQVNSESNLSKALTAITRQIRSSLVEDNVLKTTVVETRKALQADRVIVYSFDEQWYGTVVAEAVLPGYPKALWACIKDPCFTEGYIDQYREGRVQATPNIETAGLTRCHLQQLEPFAVRANLVAPILKDDNLYGLLVAHQCSGPRQWQSSEIELFTQLAVQVGFALEHARLLDQVEQAYQTAEASSVGQQQQRAKLQQDLQSWLAQNRPAVKALSADVLNQMERITTLYQHFKGFSGETQATLRSLSYQATQGEQVQEVLNHGQDLGKTLQKSLAEIQTGLASTTQQVEQLSSPAQQLTEITQFIQQMTSQMKLQAMNAALEASRVGDAQEFTEIGEKVMELARQLESKTAELTTVTHTLESQLGEAVKALHQEMQQVQSGLHLGDQSEQTLTQMVNTNIQLQSLIQSLIESTQRQSEVSATAHQTILEVASEASRTSEQAIALNGTLDHLARLSHGEQLSSTP